MRPVQLGPCLQPNFQSLTCGRKSALDSQNFVVVPMAEQKPDPSQSLSEKDVKSPNLLERAKEEIQAISHHDKSPHHTEETHGTSDDIDENTPLDDVRGPNVFERIKEEVEAVVKTIHPKKESTSHK